MFAFALTTPHHLNHTLTGKLGLQNLDEVPGLVFQEGFLTPEEETSCIARIDAAEGEWLNDLSRRVQRYRIGRGLATQSSPSTP